MQENLKISYYGYFTPLGGYGIANINWVKHLRRLGVDVSVHPKFSPTEGSFEFGILTEEERDMFGQSFEKRRIGIIESNPFDFDTIDTEVKIANTMCESDRVSADWPERLNKMDYIIVPNEFNRKVFIDSGVTKPIYVIPHGVDTERFVYVERGNPDIFTFGILGYLDQQDRKGAFDLIRAFCSEFDIHEPVRLVLKSSDPSFGYYRYFKDPRIHTITEPLTIWQVLEFYKQLNCFVFPSKAEGIGYPPREAMATGLPVILTNWSGLEDIALKDICYPLQPEAFEPRPNFIEQDGNWAKISIEELMYRMRYVYENYAEAREKGKAAAKYVRDHFSWQQCALSLKEFLQNV